MIGSPMSSNPKYSIPIFGDGWSTHPNHFATTAAVALRLSDALRRRFHLGFLLRSSFKRIFDLSDVPLLKDLCRERAMQFTGLNLLQWSFKASPATLMGLSFFGGDESGSTKDFGNPQPRTSRNGKLLYWGAKINGLISKGQLWRLATSSFLHANIGHLLLQVRQ